jgi:hypothetical protein
METIHSYVSTAEPRRSPRLLACCNNSNTEYGRSVATGFGMPNRLMLSPALDSSRRVSKPAPQRCNIARRSREADAPSCGWGNSEYRSTTCLMSPRRSERRSRPQRDRNPSANPPKRLIHSLVVISWNKRLTRSIKLRCSRQVRYSDLLPYPFAPPIRASSSSIFCCASLIRDS